MKTTLDIADGLLIRAKKRAIEERRPLRRLVEDALRDHLAAANRAGADGETAVRIEWVTAPGGLPDGVDVADRAAMHDWIRRSR